MYTPVDTGNILKDWKTNFEQLTKLADEAKARGDLVGRYITRPIADGCAYYQIIRKNKNSVRIRVCTGMGDDWVIPAWGYEVTISMEILYPFIKRMDYVAKLSPMSI